MWVFFCSSQMIQKSRMKLATLLFWRNFGFFQQLTTCQLCIQPSVVRCEVLLHVVFCHSVTMTRRVLFLGGFSWRCCEYLAWHGTISWRRHRKAHGCRQVGFHWLHRGRTILGFLSLSHRLVVYDLSKKPEHVFMTTWRQRDSNASQKCIAEALVSELAGLDGHSKHCIWCF